MGDRKWPGFRSVPPTPTPQEHQSFHVFRFCVLNEVEVTCVHCINILYTLPILYKCPFFYSISRTTITNKIHNIAGTWVNIRRVTDALPAQTLASSQGIVMCQASDPQLIRAEAGLAGTPWGPAVTSAVHQAVLPRLMGNHLNPTWPGTC